MLDDIAEIRQRFSSEPTLDGRIDQAFVAMKRLGFDALIYDYTPVPYDLAGDLMIPSLLKLRNISEDMHEYWCERGYFRIDPVQQLALRTTTPFFWNYDRDAGTLINRETENLALCRQSTAPPGPQRNAPDGSRTRDLRLERPTLFGPPKGPVDH